jgi:hypothetical protein
MQDEAAASKDKAVLAQGPGIGLSMVLAFAGMADSDVVLDTGSTAGLSVALGGDVSGCSMEAR